MASFGSGLVLVLACAAALVGIVYGQQKLNVSSPTVDYINQNVLQNQHVIEEFERQITQFRERYITSLKGLDVQSQLVEQKLREAETQLAPLELLGGISKYCVQKYRNQLTPVPAVKKALSECSNGALSEMNTFVAAAAQTASECNNYYLTTFQNSIVECQKRFPALRQNYTICIIQVVNTANSVTIAHQKKFSEQLTGADCNGGSRITQAVDCSFKSLYDVIAKIGETMRLIDNCIAGKEFCPPCTTVSESCPNVVNVSLRDADFRNATISNPFYGMSGNATCLQVNFKHIEL